MKFFTTERIKLVKDLINLSEKTLAEEQVTDENDVTNLSELLEDYKLEHSERYKQVHNYLTNLDFEDLKFVQTVMYIGRDDKFSNNDDTPEEIYESKFNSLSWNTQVIEAGQIAEKVPLAEYLKDGLEILQLD